MQNIYSKEEITLRTILHSDCNNFYASVECAVNPHYKNKPIAVSGNADERHGIILAKNETAKKFGVKTGETIWQARKKCPDIITLPPHFELYMEISKIIKKIYYEYSDRVESFGLDEAWIDVTASRLLHGDGAQIAHTIRKRTKNPVFCFLRICAPSYIFHKKSSLSSVIL